MVKNGTFQCKMVKNRALKSEMAKKSRKIIEIVQNNTKIVLKYSKMFKNASKLMKICWKWTIAVKNELNLDEWAVKAHKKIQIKRKHTEKN